MSKKHFALNDDQYHYMFAIPPKVGRYVVLDTETTGMNPRVDNIIELAAHEISNGRLTGAQFHIYLKPRIVMSQSVIKIHTMNNEFYNENYKNVYETERDILSNFIKFVGSSIIFAHNAPFDMQFINSELRFRNLTPLDPLKFRCTMRIFLNVTSVIKPEEYAKCSLVKCCEYFHFNITDDNFHTAIYDSLMTARLLCKLLDMVDSEKALKENKKINYTAQTIDVFLSKENINNSNSDSSNEDKKKKNKRKRQIGIAQAFRNSSKENVNRNTSSLIEEERELSIKMQKHLKKPKIDNNNKKVQFNVSSFITHNYNIDLSPIQCANNNNNKINDHQKEQDLSQEIELSYSDLTSSKKQDPDNNNDFDLSDEILANFL